MAERWSASSPAKAGARSSEPAILGPRRWAPAFAGERIALAIALAFPDRLSRRRDPSGEHWQSVGGRGFRLDPASPLARSEWLAVAEVAGAASGARILSAAAIELSEVEASVRRAKSRPTPRSASIPATAAISATKGRRLGSIKLSSAPDPRPDQAAIEAGLLDAVRRHGLAHPALE